MLWKTIEVIKNDLYISIRQMQCVNKKLFA